VSGGLAEVKIRDDRGEHRPADVGSGAATGNLESPAMTSLFCRHNRFTADCPICSKGTVLDPERTASRSRPSSSPAGAARRSGGGTAPRSAAASKVARVVTGPYVSAGPYAPDDDGTSYDVRLERVPGGVRLAAWSRGQLMRGAPVLDIADVPALVAQARERSLLPERDLAALESALATAASGDGAEFGASPGRAGDMREELRFEPLGDGRARIARWIMRPNFGWELQDAPVMLPAKRYAEALRQAARAGLLPTG
jgi:hypothetical protein